MVNAGRVLIIPQGDWSSLEPYQMLDLVTYDKTAYLARKASVGVNPQTDVQKVYWQPFGTAVEIATTEKPGIVMPDGTTITISQAGVIEAHLILGEAEDVDIVNPQNGQVLSYSSILDAWQNKSLGTAASKNSTSSITSGSTDLIESGAVHSLKQTLETAIGDKIDTNNIANNLTTNTPGKVLDATQGKALNDSKADQSLLAPIQATLVASKPYTIGEQFVYQGLLYKATAAIAQGGTITIDGNCELSNDVTDQIYSLYKSIYPNYSTATKKYQSTAGTNANYTITEDGLYKIDTQIGATALANNVVNTNVNAIIVMYTMSFAYYATTCIVYLKKGAQISSHNATSSTVTVVYKID